MSEVFENALSDEMRAYMQIKATYDPARLDSIDSSLAQKVQQGDIVVSVKDKAYGAKGDGVTDDTTAIQNAINYVYGLGGGTVVIPPSANPFVFTTITVKTNVILKGLGGILKLKDNTCVSGTTPYYLVHNLNYDHATFDGLIIDGNSTKNLSFQVADGITAVGNGTVVKNCHIYNVPDSGIMFSGVQNGLCVDNRINGINAWSANTSYTVGQQIQASGNVYQCTTAGTSGSTNPTGTGTSITDGTVVWSYVCGYSPDAGIYVNDGNSGNNLFESVISRNRITNFPTSAIAIKRVSSKIIVSDNTIYNCGNGITFEQASSSTDYSLNSTIVNNRIRYTGYITGTQNPTSPGIGINLRESHYSIVANNRIEDVRTKAILVEATNYATIKGNVVTITSNADTNNDSIGIHLIDRDGLGCNNNVIEGNIIKDFKYYGIMLAAGYTSQYNVIIGNIVRTTMSNAIAMRVGAAFTYNTIIGNTLDGNTFYDLEYYSGAVSNTFTNNTLINGLISGGNDQTNRTAYLQLYKGNVISVGSTAPTTGTWKQGDIVFNTSPSSNGTIGFVCVTAGSPGTWQPFGAINPMVNPSNVVVSQNASQSIPASAFTKVQFQSKTIDKLSEFDATTNYRFTAQKVGTYLVSASVGWSAPASSGNRTVISVFKNGSEAFRLYDSTSGGATTSESAGSTQITLSANDYIEIYAFTSNALSTVANALNTYCNITRIQ